MMPRTWIAPIVIAAAILVPRTARPAQAGEGPSAASLARIRKALEAPPARLQPPAPSTDMPTFRVEVHEPLVNLDPIDEEPFDPTMGLPSAGDLLMGGIGKIRSAVADHRRKGARRRARKEVQDALAAFCAVHACPASAPK